MATCVNGKRVTTLNDLPTPCGDWQQLNGSRQKRHTLTLIFGITCLAITLTVCNQMGVFYLNYLPPDRPADRTDNNKKK